MNPWSLLLDRLAKGGGTPATPQAGAAAARPDGGIESLLQLAVVPAAVARALGRTPLAMLVADAAGQLCHCGPGCEPNFGWRLDSLGHRPALENLFGPATAHELRLQLDGAASPPGDLAWRCNARAADGRAMPVQVDWLPLYPAGADAATQAGPVGSLLLVRDIGHEAAAARVVNLSARLGALMDAAPSQALIMLDATGRVAVWSHVATTLSGLADADAVGQPLAALFTADDEFAAGPLELLDEARRRGRAAGELCLRRRDGTLLRAAARLRVLDDPVAGAGFALALHQRTRGALAALEVAASEARLAAVIAGASDAIISTDLDGRVQLFNPAAERIFQVSAAEMLGQPLDRLLPAGASGRHPVHLADFGASRVASRPMGTGKVEGRRADGAAIELEASISQATVAGRTVLTAILRDVTERARADRALVGYQVQLAGLAQRLLAQEKETTRRLAQALHDDLGQTLGAMRLIYDNGMRKRPPGEDAPDWLGRIDRLIADANSQVRRVLMELRPPLLDEHGLVAALDNELRQRLSPYEDVELQYRWDGVPPEQRWPMDVEYSAFMVAREAVINALHHAKPGVIIVTLEGDEWLMQLSVTDDGSGGDLEAGKPGHLGLVGMRERALAIGGVLTIHSEPGAGTTVSLTWGVPDEPIVSGR